MSSVNRLYERGVPCLCRGVVARQSGLVLCFFVLKSFCFCCDSQGPQAHMYLFNPRYLI